MFIQLEIYKALEYFLFVVVESNQISDSLLKVIGEKEVGKIQNLDPTSVKFFPWLRWK